MDVLALILTAAVSSTVSAVIAVIVAVARTKAHDTVDGAKAMQEGIRALLWRELTEIHARTMDEGGMTLDERQHLVHVYDAYHGLGGNGTGTRIYEESMGMPSIER